MKPYIFYLLLLLFVPLISESQQILPDSTNLFEEEYPDILNDSTIEMPDYMPADMIFIPSDVLYNNSWDNTNVRAKREDLSTIEDTILLYLSHPSENKFVFPHPGRFLSPFGYRGRHFHAGVDVKLNLGDTVVSAFDGKVRLAKRYRGYGNLVVIRHFNGLETVYGHLSKLIAHVNDDVKAGDIIGLGGRTGRATTTHLHFETRFLGEPFNPNTFINFDNFTLSKDTVQITSSLFSYAAKVKNKKNGKHGYQRGAGNNETSSYHTVKKGDTLAKIAKSHNMTVSAICKANKITKRTPLKIGKHLKIN